MRITEGDFLIPVDKPVGPTSHDVVSKARKALGMRRIGHTGTLDPFASGLLVLCAGRATRLAEYITGMDKGYEAVACLGIETDTLDLSGEVTSMNDRWRSIDSSSLEEVVLSQIGLIEQKPPQFSAKKIDGEPMYRRARRGEVIPLPAVQVTIYELASQSGALAVPTFVLLPEISVLCLDVERILQNCAERLLGNFGLKQRLASRNWLMPMPSQLLVSSRVPDCFTYLPSRWTKQ